MINKFEPHKSSLDLDANIVVLIAYIGGILISFIPSIRFLAFLVPIIIYCLEKDSKFVKFHAMQGILLNLLGLVFSIILGILLSIFAALVIMGSGTGAFSLRTLTGILSLVVPITMFIFIIIASVKSWNYECYEIPVIGKYTSKIVFK